MRFGVILVSIALLFSFISGTRVRHHTQKQTAFISQPSGEKCYGVMLDAGSSSTKMNIYSWPCRDFLSLPKFNPKSELTIKVSPGISKLAQNIPGIQSYLQPLIDKAKQIVPQSYWTETPIMFGATAGMRLLTETEQANILDETRVNLHSSGFFFKSDSWARVISGQEEGVFLWIATNYLLGAITNNTDIINQVPTVATLDLGGASTQIAFQPRRTNDPSLSLDVSVPENNSYSVYSVSYLGYGNDQARISVINLSNLENSDTIRSGCLNSGYKYVDSKSNKNVVGTSNPEECIQNIKKFFNIDDCPSNSFTCSINGVYQPLIPRDRAIYAVSGFHTAAASFGLSANFTANELRQKAVQFCKLSFDTISQQSPNDPYVSTKCFLGLYAATLLLDGYKIGNSVISSPNDINGAEPAWAMGYLFETVANYKCEDLEVSACSNWKGMLSPKNQFFIQE